MKKKKSANFTKNQLWEFLTKNQIGAKFSTWEECILLCRVLRCSLVKLHNLKLNNLSKTK